MAAKFEIFTDKGGKFRFNLKAANGEITASDAQSILRVAVGQEILPNCAAALQEVARDRIGTGYGF